MIAIEQLLPRATKIYEVIQISCNMVNKILEEITNSQEKLFTVGEEILKAYGIPEKDIEEIINTLGKAFDAWAKMKGAESIDPMTKKALINEAILAAIILSKS